MKRSKRKAPAVAPPPQSSPWLAWEVVGWASLLIVVCALYLHFVSTASHQRSLEQRLKRWKTKYLLTEFELARLRALEVAFHGSGSPFSRPTPSADDNARHRREIAALLPSDAAQRFLEAQKTKSDSEEAED